MSEQMKHPGDVLMEKWLQPRGLTQYRVAKQLHVETRRINEVIEGLRNITPEMAVRLALFFENDPRYWLELQMRYDLTVAVRKHGAKLKREIRPWSKVKPADAPEPPAE